MKKALNLLPIVLLLLSCSGKKEVNTLKVPEVTRFKMNATGDVHFYGKGMNELKAMNTSFDFSIASNEFLKDSRIIFIGKALKIENDSTILINPSSIDKIELQTGDSVSAEVRSISGTKQGAAAKMITITDKELIKRMIAHISTSKHDYNVWLTLSDNTKQFWDPKDPSESSFTIGFYQLWERQNGNFSKYAKIPVLEWMEHTQK